MWFKVYFIVIPSIFHGMYIVERDRKRQRKVENFFDDELIDSNFNKSWLHKIQQKESP